MKNRAITLDEFVSDSIVSIVEAVHDARKKLKEKGIDAEISPPLMQGLKQNTDSKVLISHKGYPIHDVEFDLNIALVEKEGIKTGIGVVSQIFKLGADAEKSKNTENHSRIKFTIPLTIN